MAALVANAAEIRAGASTGPTDVLDGATQFSLQRSRDMLDATNFKDGVERIRKAGLPDATFTFSGQYEPGDTAYTAIETAESGGSTVYIRIAYDGSTGHEIPCLVQDIETNGSVDGLIEVSATLMLNGSVSTF